MLSQTGTSTAVPRFSYFVVPAGQVPSMFPNFLNTDTGRASPSCRFMGTTTSRTKAGSASSAAGASFASAQDAGISTRTSSLTPRSRARQFMSTTACPRLT